MCLFAPQLRLVLTSPTRRDSQAELVWVDD